MKVINTLFLTASLGLAAAPGARAAVIFDTTTSASLYTVTINSSRQQAQSFRTGSTGSQLSSVLLFTGPDGVSGGGFSVSLYNAIGTSPYNPASPALLTLSGEANPYTAGNYTYTGSYALAANTDYWIVLACTSGTYRELKSDSAPSVGTSPYGRADYYYGWTVYGAGNYLDMQISSLSAVPEPSEWAAISFGVLGIIWVAKRRFMPARSASSPMRAA